MKHILYKIKNITNTRLADMGFIRGTTFRIVKRVLGMIQIRLDSGNDVVIREETLKDIEYDS